MSVLAALKVHYPPKRVFDLPFYWKQSWRTAQRSGGLLMPTLLKVCVSCIQVFKIEMWGAF